MTIHSSAGSSLAISAAQPATFNAAGYAALTFTEIGEIENVGETGRNYTKIEFKPLKNRGVKKFKGSYDPGTIELAGAYDSADAGQILLKTASTDDDNYSFCLTDQPGNKRYFQGQVMSFKRGIGGVDDITSLTSMIEITLDTTGNDFIDVAAT